MLETRINLSGSNTKRIFLPVVIKSTCHYNNPRIHDVRNIELRAHTCTEGSTKAKLGKTRQEKLFLRVEKSLGKWESNLGNLGSSLDFLAVGFPRSIRVAPSCPLPRSQGVRREFGKMNSE